LASWVGRRNMRDRDIRRIIKEAEGES